MPKLDRTEVIATFYKLRPRDCVGVLGNIVETMLHYQDGTAQALWRQMKVHADRHEQEPEDTDTDEDSPAWLECLCGHRQECGARCERCERPFRERDHVPR